MDENDTQCILLGFIGVMVGTILLIYEITDYPRWVDILTSQKVIVLMLMFVYPVLAVTYKQRSEK